MSEIVVFGGNGFIGRSLVPALLAQGHRVRVASRTQPPVSEAGGNPRRVRADVSDPASVAAAVEGADVVISLASGGGATWADFERDFVRGARNVGEACLAAGVKRLLYASSSAALWLAGSTPLDEQGGVDPKPEARSLYSRAKIAAEAELARLRRERGLPVVVLRPAVVVGAGGLLAHSGLGQWPSPTRCVGRGGGDSPIPFVLVKDVVQAFVAAVDAPAIEGLTFNLAGDVRPTAREYLREVAERTRRDFRFAPRPLAAHQAIEIAKWLVKAAGRKKENPFPSWRDLSSRTMERPIENREAKRRLGWMPCNDLRSFYDEAIGPHVRPIPEGDLRLREG